MNEQIFRLSARLAVRECVVGATDHFGFDLEAALRDAELIDDEIQLVDQDAAKEAFDMVWDEVDWRDRESILPFIPIFESCYEACPRNFSSIHNYLDTVLAHEGYRMKAGRLIRMPM